MLRECFKCSIKKPIIEFESYYYKSKLLYGFQCRTCRLKYKREHSKKYFSKLREMRRTDIRIFIDGVYTSMKQRVSDKSNNYLPYKGLFICEKEEFIKFGLNDNNLKVLYKIWKKSNYSRKLTPSIDRIENQKGYSLNNIQFLTLEENGRKK